MKIKIKGELSMQDLIQAIYEKLHEMEDRYRVRHSKDVVIFFTPTDGEGEEVACTTGTGKEVKVIQSNGPYRSVADKCDM